MDDQTEGQNLAKKIGDVLSKDLSLTLSLAYVALIGIGMMFTYQYYDIWGIDIFQFAGFEDFLLAPFRDMLVFFFAVVSVLFSFLAIELSKKLDKKYPHLSKYWNLGLSVESKNYNFYMNINLMLGILIYLHLSATGFAILRKWRFKKHPEENRVEIELEGQKAQNFLLLGLTENYAIVLSENDRKVSAFPLEGGVRCLRFSSGKDSVRQSVTPASGLQVPD